MFKEDDVDIIAEDIMEYLSRRPMASDTLEGVVHWWLLQQSIVQKKILVERALEKLTEQGKVSKTINANQDAVYSLAAND